MKSPLIDPREFRDIAKEMRELAPFFTPEWDPDSDKDAGTAVMDIFARMYAGILQRLNRVPDKNFIAFLNRLGLQLLPASQARGPVTFALSSGALDSVVIPARTQVAAPPNNGGKPIVFETERTIAATPAKIKRILSYYPNKDRISEAPAAILDASSNTPFEIFEESVLQSHALYIGHSDLLKVRAATNFLLSFTGRSMTGPQLDLFANTNVMQWHYSSDSDGGWKPMTAVHEGGQIKLSTDESPDIAETTVNGVKSRWIRASVRPNQIKSTEGIQFENITLSIDQDLTQPDLAYYNNVPLDVDANKYFPFGVTPRLYDTFYVASKEAFSKKGATVTLDFTLTHKIDWIISDNPLLTAKRMNGISAQLSWEYWNGQGWMRLGKIDENFWITNKEPVDGRSVQVIFTVPSEMSETIVQGQSNYWIRCKLVSGDFGKEVFSGNALEARFYAPKISRLHIKYKVISQTAQHIATYNNLTYLDCTDDAQKGRLIQPFYRLADVHPALYIGFDKPPIKGPNSVYFHVQDQEYRESDFPRLEWDYYRASDGRSGWARLDVQDFTRHLTQSGCVEFIGPPDLAIPEALFGTSLYWIRAVDTENRFQSKESSRLTHLHKLNRISQSHIAVHSNKEESCSCGPEPCDDFVLFDPRFSSSSDNRIVPSPLLNGIFLNTTMAVHSESIAGEILGSSIGQASATYQFTKYPVLSEQIYINELSVLSEEERKALIDNPGMSVREIKDDAGVTTSFWVLWTAVDSLQETNGEGRHYEIDRTFGTVQFGNGVYGKIPPIGRDNLSSDYQAGGGSAGNIASGELKSMRTSIAYVNSPNNPYAFECGYDTEPLARALERGPLMIRTRNRAVTAADYEQLTLQASRGIAKAKCLPNFNDKGERETGWVTVLIVPRSSETKPVPSHQLRQQVEESLRSRAANIAAAPRHIKVFGPVYAEVSISARLIASTFDAMPTVETEAYRKLTAYLHPLTGGKDGRGWDFGNLPCLSEFYSLLEADRNVDHVEELVMTILDPASGKSLQVTSNSPADIRSVPYLLLYSGEHKLVVSGVPVLS
ncbi:putative baseplate assembly protein [Paenibacillus spongiae]|uniref:Baseplate assembly protein n=1 Tax=Paenibacillus spongiae TaxID=2909671 RepID=A0ABY5S4Y5_9BACL|nr:putative baseplate assembly protein [Paenibacillus spongiae]UVI27388.1 putative baseplate assembly protein [Paenibacillus spongiae]